jgi:hypothetical protein
MNKTIPVYIECYDHYSELGWMSKKKFNKLNLAVIYVSGFLTEETDLCYKVSGQICGDGEIGDTFTIIKSSVIKIEKLPLAK